MKLTIDIADTDLVQIDEREMTDAGARERLDGPRADAADAHDADMRRAQSRQRVRAEQPPDTAEPKLEERKRLGLMAVLYLLITAILLYIAKRRVWASEPH